MAHPFDAADDVRGGATAPADMSVTEVASQASAVSTISLGHGCGAGVRRVGVRGPRSLRPAQPSRRHDELMAAVSLAARVAWPIQGGAHRSPALICRLTLHANASEHPTTTAICCGPQSGCCCITYCTWSDRGLA